MSLNGLDDPEIAEVYETAASEPGGWFLLKYSDRDTVELLGRGNGGVVEIRSAVTEYDETSPLYGFLKYRRRNVIVKHLPEDCSRLIRARVAVHFNAVCERFSPFDTTFEITTAAELRDTKLSSACSLHAASCSTSSSTSSLRRRRLMEIAEEEEEGQRASKRQSIQTLDRDGLRLSTAGGTTAEPVALDSQLATSPEHTKFSAGSTAELPTFVGLDPRPPSSAKSTDASSTQFRPELFSSYSAPYGKPKVKLGPRPSLDVNGRPHTAGSFRPISALPVGFKLFGKGAKKDKRSKSPSSSAQSSAKDSAETVKPSAASMLEAPGDDITGTDPVAEGPAPDFPQVSRPQPKKAIISPEKARLMKAMQLREKKKTTQLQCPIVDPPSGPESTPEDEEKLNEAAEQNVQVPADFQVAATLESKPVESGSNEGRSRASVHNDQKSDFTQSDSRPASPIVTSSEAEQSTKASSLSESTDETVRDRDNRSLPDDQTKSLANGELGAGVQGYVGHQTHASDATSEKLSASISEDTEPREPLGNLPDPDTALGGSVAETSDTASADDDVAKSAPLDPDDSAILAQTRSSAVVEPAAKACSQKSEADESTTPTNADKKEFLREPSADTVQSTLQSNTSATTDTRFSSAFHSQVADASSPEQGHMVESETSSDSASRSERKRLIRPIQVLPAPHSRHASRSEMNLSDDEELMDELQSATVEEAKPLIVAKTPVSATFSIGPGRQATTPNSHSVRTASNPVRGNLVVPTDVSQSSARSLSAGAAYLHQVTQQQQAGNLANKPNIGSSISQRIKALERLSAASGEPGGPGARERPSSTFFAVKKRETSRSPSVMERADSLRRQTPESRPQSKEGLSEAVRLSRRDRSTSVTGRLPRFESPPAMEAGITNNPTSASRRGHPESVSVTAKIVRDPTQSAQTALGPPRDPSEYSRLDLKQSPLLVDHREAVPEPSPPAAVLPSPPERRSTSHERTKLNKSRQTSLGIVKDFIKERRKSVTSNQGDAAVPSTALPPRSLSRSPPVVQNTAFSPRLSISSPRSSMSQDRQNVTSPVCESSGDDGKSASSDKKLSRAGRFMRRLSTFSASRSKNSPPGPAQAVAEEVIEAAAPRPATTGSPTIVSHMGDVNVQFPDTLLWKRRNLSLDSQGYLILSALPAHGGRLTQGVKRYHLGEFRPPYIPDVELQELPNSVVLDFIEGTSIQFACEDRAGQTNVLGSESTLHAMRDPLVSIK